MPGAVLLECMPKSHQVGALVSLGEGLPEPERARLVQALVPSLPERAFGTTMHT